MSSRDETSAAGAGSGAPFGILGGTFNPPHRGHLALARHALGELGLERVLLMPAGRSPHKEAGDDPGPGHRLRMCQLAIGDAAGLEVCALEAEAEDEGPSYTVETLRALHAAHPGVRATFLLGADVARTLPSWREPRELLGLVDLAVALRNGTDSSEIGRREVCEALRPLLSDIEGVGERVSFLRMPPIEVSSSQVRERVRRGAPIVELVGPAVANYIAAHDLYRSPPPSGAPIDQRNLT
jgi:nicotinate-nucleotide adenylyltransferase